MGMWFAVLACGTSLGLAAPGRTHAAPGPSSRAGQAGAQGNPGLDAQRLRHAMGRVLVMERQTLADLEGVGRGSLARRAHAAWATVADTTTIAGVLRDARAHGPGCAQGGREGSRRGTVCDDLEALSAWNRGMAAAAGILGDLAELGTLAAGLHPHPRLDASGGCEAAPCAPNEWPAGWQRILRDAQARLGALGPVAHTSLGRTERAEIGLLGRATAALTGRLPWAYGLCLAEPLRRNTIMVGAAIDPYRALVRRRVATLIRAVVRDAASRTGP